ncbi:MAG: metal ABC transporter permease, partial [Actinomycetota bacterium]|nr:metal ABC transporter permease [Actinomycetota bacterium]
ALFGSILGVGDSDVLAVGVVSSIAAAIVFFAYRPLLFTSFDPEVADVSGVRTATVDALLMFVLAASVLVTMRVLGVTLIAAALVIPPTVARMLTNSFKRMLLLSTIIGTASGFVGMIASYHLDVQSGPTIVLTSACVFVWVFASTSPRGFRRSRTTEGYTGLPSLEGGVVEFPPTLLPPTPSSGGSAHVHMSRTLQQPEGR